MHKIKFTYNTCSLICFQLIRIWHKTKVSIGINAIVLANFDEETVIDQVPLCDVELVQDMSTVNAGIDGSKFMNAIVIKTSSTGHNGGRTYYLKANSQEECIGTVKLLKDLAHEASIQVRAKTKFARIRLKARDLFNSSYFQLASGFLILAVRGFCFGSNIPVL